MTVVLAFLYWIAGSFTVGLTWAAVVTLAHRRERRHRRPA